MNHGVFLNTLVTFLIIAAVVFLLVRSINSLRQKEEGPPPPATVMECPFCRLMVPLHATRCGHCTSEIPQGA